MTDHRATDPTRTHRPTDRRPRIDDIAERAARLQAIVDRQAARGGIAHVVAGVASVDGTFQWSGAAGEARPDGASMRPDTPWFVASVTKLVIATTILQLAEERRVDLDAPITAYLPSRVTDGLHRIGDVDHTPRVTVRHLLSHTSGLSDFLEDRPAGGRSWYRELVAGEDRSWTFDDVVRRTREELPARFEPQDLAAPKQRARYSDTGYQLLIAITETVAGRPVEQVWEQRLFRPLGMRHTYLPGRSQPLDPAPVPALVYDRARPLDVPRTLASCMDLISTTDDMIRLMRALVRGEVFADPATAELRYERWNRIGYPLRYGLGTMRFPINRLVGPGRRPATLLGHSGATGSFLFHCPEFDVVLTGTVDQVRGRTIPFRLMARLLSTYAS